MAVLGIISILLMFSLFSFAFVDFDELRGGKKKRHPFDIDYYVIDNFQGEIQVSTKQEEIYNYLLKKQHATKDILELACDCTKEDLDELEYLGVIRVEKVEKNPSPVGNIVKGILSVLIIAFIFYSANYYFLFKINFRYVGIIIYVAAFLVFAIIYFTKFTFLTKEKVIQIAFGIGGLVVFVLVFYLLFGGRTYFHAASYSELISVQEDDFGSDVQTVDVETLPIVDKQYGEKLGLLKLGEYPGIGSEFETGEYSDIIYQGEQYLVSPLEYRGIFKWFNNNEVGTPGYIMINKVTAETTLVNIRETEGLGMKYTPSAFFGQDLVRHAYMNGMHKYQLEKQFFEIDEDGDPYYVLMYSLPTIFINGGRDIAKIAVVNAISGDVDIYDVEDVPSWIESVYPSDLLLNQLNYWGALQDGWINSVFGQRGVLQSSNGKRTIMNDGELFYFTGLTSAGADESTIGFVYMSTRTKETILYKFPGATETAAMNKTVTLLPQNNIFTAFPIPINVNEVPTYFIAIKGEDGRILRYVFMNVQELEIYGIEETKAKAYTDYLTRLGSSNVDDLNTVTGDITEITSYVLDGNTVYWIELDNDELYMLNVSTIDSEQMMYFVSLGVGDEITLNIQGNTVIAIETD
jgi:hypothetical protein